ncbi:YIP1 family protein [Roseivivax sp. CAU 1761]
MSAQGFFALAWQSVVAPREVARFLLSIHPGREALILLFALILVVQTGLVVTAALISPPDPVLAPFMAQPPVFLAGYGGLLVALILALTWSGRALGGRGRFEEMALLVIWVQALRLLVQGLGLALGLAAPVLAGLLALAASAAAIWILVNFLAEAHGLAAGRAAFALLLALTGLALGLSFFLTLFGATTTMGLNAHV